MALKATICKATFTITDQVRHVYETLSVTLAQHPSETPARLMTRLLAFSLNFEEKLSFTKGLSTDEEPEIWLKSDDGITRLWIDLGMIEPDRIKKATRQSEQVIIYTYQGKDLKSWIDRCSGNIGSSNNLQVFDIGSEAASALAELHSKSMDLNIIRDDNTVWISNEEQTVEIEIVPVCQDSRFLTV